jgi:hypothetical protein
LALLALFLSQPADVRAQWTTPDASQNINNTNTGNVGVGTTTPNYKLDVSNLVDKAQIRFGMGALDSGGFLFSNAPSHAVFSGGASWNGGWIAKSISASFLQANTGSLMFFANNGLTSGSGFTPTERMRISASGYLGIGTTNPTSKLHVMSGTDSGTTLLSLDTGVHGGTSMAVFGTANNESGFDLSVYRSGQYFSRFGVGSNGSVYLQPSSGNVGIGTASPAYKLEVSGEINATGLRINGAPVGGSSQWTTAGTSVYYNGGNVGIGTAAPLQKLQVGSNVATSTNTPDSISLGGTYSATAGANAKLRLWDDNTGNAYGLGTSLAQFDFMAPSGARYVWNVNGVEKMRLDATGNFTVAGNISAKYQDVAEWVESSQDLQAGTVVVLDSTKSNQVVASTQGYDTRVAGVISLRPGLALGEAGEAKVLVATTGRVRMRVDATSTPIQIGDLLVTGDKEGMAMKSMPVDIGGVRLHRPGTLIGKALEPLAKGTGEILVLLSLQ